MSKPNPVQNSTVTFEFSNPEAADHFLTWMSESGEQDYWNWMEYRETEEDGDITGVDFDYWKKNPKKEFGPDVKVRCGRLTRGES